MTKQLLENMVDELLEANFDHFLNKIDEIRNLDQEIYTQVHLEIKQHVRHQKFHTLTLDMLKIVKELCRTESRVDSDAFKNESVYASVAVLQGYQQNKAISIQEKEQIRGYFIRNIKKQAEYWGVSLLQNLHSNLVNKSHSSYYLKPTQQINSFLFQFLLNNLILFPPSIQAYKIILKHMLMLQPDKKNQLPIFTNLLKKFLSYPYHQQILTKHFRFCLQFFRNSFNEKQYSINPQLALINLLKNYDDIQIKNMLGLSSLGLTWNSGEIKHCVNNVLKFGINEQNYRIMKCFIEFGKDLKKYDDLLDAYTAQIQKIFIFLKFPQLFAPSLKLLKEMILGPWPITALYNLFIAKAIQFTKNKPPNEQFSILVQGVILKYKETTLTEDLSKIIEVNKLVGLQEKARKQILAYQWKLTQDKKGKQGQKQLQDEELFRGITNIGNSCYMNSFLQALFMNKQFRKQVLSASTLAQEQQLLQILRNKFKANKTMNIPSLARSSVRPLAELQRFFSLLLKSKRTCINPKTIKNISPTEFQNTFQHDSIEFGRSIIELISQSNFENVFQGEAVTQIECPFCSTKRRMKEDFLDVMLVSKTFLSKEKVEGQGNLQQIEGETIEQLILNSFQEEFIQGLTCEQCNNKAETGMEIEASLSAQQNKSRKSHWISKYPNYLILTLKRFQYNIKQNKNLKKNFKVHLKQEFTIDLQGIKVQYMIYAMIIHRGLSANSGHYFTFARENFKVEDKEGRWVCLNDSNVSKMSDFSKVIEFLEVNSEDTPYIIFGCRKQHWLQSWQKMQETLILRGPLQNFIEQDNKQYVKSISNSKLIGTLDLSMLKFGTGSYYRKDEDDEDPYGGGGFGMGFHGHNNPII